MQDTQIPEVQMTVTKQRESKVVPFEVIDVVDDLELPTLRNLISNSPEGQETIFHP